MTAPRPRVAAGRREGGRFTSSARAETGLELPPRICLSDYLPHGVDDYVDTPWLMRHQHITLAPQDWQRVPVRAVALQGLRRTQKRVLVSHVRRHLDGGQPQGGDLAWVVHHEGLHWLLDGHHRAVAAMMRGESSMNVHVMDLAADPHIYSA